ncbi:MAG: hypothetical protein NTU51_06070 [Bacteroidetes bacterium]|nr:hypothetical protein [Bacteroidota bacterium]
MDHLNHPTPSDVQCHESKSNPQERLLPDMHHKEMLARLRKKNQPIVVSQLSQAQRNGIAGVGRWSASSNASRPCKLESGL